jgi:hypothetical protein
MSKVAVIHNGHVLPLCVVAWACCMWCKPHSARQGKNQGNIGRSRLAGWHHCPDSWHGCCTAALVARYLLFQDVMAPPPEVLSGLEQQLLGQLLHCYVYTTTKHPHIKHYNACASLNTADKQPINCYAVQGTCYSQMSWHHRQRSSQAYSSCCQSNRSSH